MYRVTAAAVVLIIAGDLAHAEPPSLTPPCCASVAAPLHAREVQSYRGSIFAADATAVALMLWSLHREQEFDNSAGLVALSVTSYALVAPAIHLVKRRGNNALASLGLRVGVPLVAGFIGDKLAGCDYDYDLTDGKCDDYDLGGWVTGMVVGAVVASSIDTMFLARAERAPSAATTRSAWTPTARTTRGGGLALGISGRF